MALDVLMVTVEGKASLCRSGSGICYAVHDRLLGAGATETTRYNVWRTFMKALISMVAIALALAVTGPAFAGEDVTKATDKASCDKAGGVWDDAAKKCAAKM